MGNRAADEPALDAYVGGIRAKPVIAGGRPGIFVSVPPLPPLEPGSLFRKDGRELRGFLIVEGADGLPRGARVIVRPDRPLRLGRVPLEDGSGPLLAFGLLAGRSIVLHLRIALPIPMSLVLKGIPDRIAATLAERIRPAVEASKLSKAFRDALECTALWGYPPAEGDIAALYAHDVRGERLRAHCLAHPFPAMLGYEEASHAAESGPVPAPGMPPGVLAKLSRRVFSPGDDAFSEAIGPVMAVPASRAAVLSLLGAIPPDWMPSTGDEAAAFVLVGRLAGIAEATGRSPLELVASSKGRWREFHDRCTADRSFGWDDPTPGLNFIHFHDPVAGLATSVVLPLLRRLGRPEALEARIHRDHPAYRAAARLLYGGKALPACIEAADRWHAALQEITGEMPDGTDPDEAWPAYAPDWTVHIRNRSRQVPCLVTTLNTSRALREEGAHGPDRNGVAGLGHCVASYRAAARRGECHILSIRRLLPDGGYERLATVEIRQHRNRSRPEVVQVQGRQDGRPDTVAGGALKAWLMREGVRPYVAPRPAADVDDPVAVECGWDWSDDVQAAQATGAYARFLHRDLRSLQALESWLSGLPEIPVAEAA